MDIRSNIIQAVIEALQGRADDDTVNLVQDVLVIAQSLCGVGTDQVPESC